MTNQQGAPEALRLAAEVLDWMPTSDTQRALWDRHQKALVVVKAALVEAQQPAAHVQNQAEIEHVAGDVSKNGPESNMPQQPAPSAAAAVGDEQKALKALHYYMTECSGHEPSISVFHRMVEEALAPQPSPTPQADSQPAPLREGEWINDAGRIKWLLWRVQDLEAKLAARAPADRVTAPAGGANWAQLRSALAMLMLGWGRNPNQTMDACYRVLDSATEPGTALAILRTAPDWRDFMAADRAKADSVLEDAARLDFLCSTDKVRMIECEQKGLWRVYQDEAPPEAVQHHWQAIASDWHTTPRAAIDAAIAARKQGANHD